MISSRLSPRQDQAVALLCLGIDQRDAARFMGITYGMFKGYMARVFDKTDLRTAHEVCCAVAWEQPTLFWGVTGRQWLTSK